MRLSPIGLTRRGPRVVEDAHLSLLAAQQERDLAQRRSAFWVALAVQPGEQPGVAEAPDVAKKQVSAEAPQPHDRHQN